MCISFGLLAAQPRPADLNRKFMVSIGERYGEHHLSMWDVSEPGAQPRLVTSLYPVEAWKEGSFERVMAAFVEAAVQDQVEGVV